MKAIVCTEYGPPDVLKLAEVQKPIPTDDQVLVRVRAASVNQVDRLFRGESYIVRALTGLRKPNDPRVGRDLAGQVEAVGRMRRFQPGDEVFGTGLGAFAEYACADQKNLGLKPLVIRLQACDESAGNLRRGWRQVVNAVVQSALAVTVREPESAHVCGGDQHCGPGCLDGAHSSPKGYTGHRQVLPIESGP